MSTTGVPDRTGVVPQLRRAITTVAVSHNEPPGVVLRRRIVVAITLLAGAVVLGISLTSCQHHRRMGGVSCHDGTHLSH